MARLGRALLALLRAYLLAVGAVATLLFCLLLFGVSQLDFAARTTPAATADEDAVLVIDVRGRLRRWRADTGGKRFLWSRLAWGVQDTWISDVRRALTLARDDSRIKAVLLDMQENLRGNLVDFAVLRTLLADFVAASDKEVVCLLSAGDNQHYFLASAADRIIITPVTTVEIPGPVLHLTYFGQALKKLGIGMQVVQTGDYKSAFEPFVRNQPSRAVLEMYGSLEQSLRRYLVSTIADGRRRTEREVRGWLARSIFTAESALTLGLVDGIGHRAAVVSALAAREEVRGEEQDEGQVVAYRVYLAEADDERAAVEDGGGIGLVEAEGTILMEGNEWDILLPRRIISELEWMRTNEEVRAVVLRIDSPGGSALASELIWKAVTRLTARKPVVVSMGEVAASGGYYLATGGSYLLAEPATITGSIGVVGIIPNLGGFENKYGVSFHLVTASERRDLYNLRTAMSDADQSIVQHSLQEVYRVFKERVAAGRELEMDEVEQLAGGRVFTGEQAAAVGLVDALGDLNAAFAKAKELADLDPAQKYPLYRYDHGHGRFLDCLRATFDITRCLEVQVSPPPARLHRYLRLLANGRTSVLALWPHFVSW